jgi:hypothetical protein
MDLFYASVGRVIVWEGRVEGFCREVKVKSVKTSENLRGFSAQLVRFLQIMCPDFSFTATSFSVIGQIF